ncbi:hypothetical protein DXT99_08260 [Pontibacter diazotrophicus]|uniref:Uncharacterized protein n=1 Tax=Pontibacter diazotrophicus TaxID=1400979 RepID=A0A3D8LDE8_9BACT|nr:hypothetical protein [Pontibacter diazotrophicus]RDV15479.1 hypothetical protein DXT99_08260 [Pontibacter diazotrophicus]
MTPHFTPFSSLEQLAGIITKERGVLQEYAAKPNANQRHIDIRDSFLQSLAGAYNQVYAEMAASSSLLHTEKWQLAEKQIMLLQENGPLDGFHIRLTLGNGNMYGFISL